jgi:hypothetical protein
MPHKNKFETLLGLAIVGGLLSLFFYINGSDEATKQAGFTYFLFIVLFLIAYIIFWRKKK